MDGIPVEKCDPATCAKCHLSADEQKWCHDLYALLQQIEATPQAERWDKFSRLGSVFAMNSAVMTVLLADSVSHAIALFCEAASLALKPHTNNFISEFVKELKLHMAKGMRDKVEQEMKERAMNTLNTERATRH